MTISPAEEVTVLHVDDDHSFTEVVSAFLEREDPRLSVCPTTSVEEALSMVEGGRAVHCVVSDYDMPEQNGLAFLEQVRARDADLPFILYTGKGSEEIASEAISAGVSEYLQKGRGTDQYTVLANRIVTLVRSRRAEDAAAQTEERYHNLVDTAPLPILLFDESGRAVYVNDAAVRFFAADEKADLEGQRFTDLLHPEASAQAEQRFARLMREGAAAPEVEYRVQTLDGTVERVSVATAPGIYEGAPVAQAIVQSQPGTDSSTE